MRSLSGQWVDLSPISHPIPSLRDPVGQSRHLLTPEIRGVVHSEFSMDIEVSSVSVYQPMMSIHHRRTKQLLSTILIPFFSPDNVIKPRDNIMESLRKAAEKRRSMNETTPNTLKVTLAN